jgi:membrane-associated HD superfamily phosphohydrolase
MILSSIYNKGILSIDSDLPFKDSIAVRTGYVDRIISREINKLNYPEDIESALIEYTIYFLYPNLQYSADLTYEEIEQAKSNISMYTDIVNENERIIAKHERISKETKLKIESYKEAKGEAIGEGGLILQGVGKFIHIALLISLLVMYLYLFRKRIFYDNQKLLLTGRSPCAGTVSYFYSCGIYVTYNNVRFAGWILYNRNSYSNYRCT